MAFSSYWGTPMAMETQILLGKSAILEPSHRAQDCRLMGRPHAPRLLRLTARSQIHWAWHQIMGAKCPTQTGYRKILPGTILDITP